MRGWDDPRMPTISGLRRRGFPPEALRQFAELIGVAKRDERGRVRRRSSTACATCSTAPRRGGWPCCGRCKRRRSRTIPEGQVEEIDVGNNPEDPAAGTRKVPFARELWIERDDFMEDPPKKFFRLAPGREVRLRAAYFITCQEVVKDAAGEVVGAALHLRSRDARAAAPPTAARPRRRCTGSPRARADGGGAPLRPPLRPARPGRRRRPARRPEPASEEVLPGCRVEPAPGRTWPRARACSSSGSATSASTTTRTPERAGLQPHGDAARHLGEGPGQELEEPTP